MVSGVGFFKHGDKVSKEAGEQMARLLEKLEEQTACQEQFYQEQSAKLDEQAALCRAQNEKLSMQLEAKLQQNTTTHQDIASKLQAQSSRQEDLISELQSRLTEFSTLAVRTQQVEEEQEVAKSRLDTLEGELPGLKKSTSTEYHQLKDMQDQLKLGCEHFRDEIKTQLKELEDKVLQELPARQETSRKELVGEAVRSPHTSAIRPLSPEFSPLAGTEQPASSGLFPCPWPLMARQGLPSNSDHPPIMAKQLGMPLRCNLRCYLGSTNGLRRKSQPTSLSVCGGLPWLY